MYTIYTYLHIYIFNINIYIYICIDTLFYFSVSNSVFCLRTRFGPYLLFAIGFGAPFRYNCILKFRIWMIGQTFDSKLDFLVIDNCILKFRIWMIGPTVDSKLDFHVIVWLYKSDWNRCLFLFYCFGFYWFFGLSTSYSNVLWVFVFVLVFGGIWGSLEHNYDKSSKNTKVTNITKSVKKITNSYESCKRLA